MCFKISEIFFRLLFGHINSVELRQYFLHLFLQFRTDDLFVIDLLHDLRIFRLHKIQELGLVSLQLVDRIFIQEPSGPGEKDRHLLAQ